MLYRLAFPASKSDLFLLCDHSFFEKLKDKFAINRIDLQIDSNSVITIGLVVNFITSRYFLARLLSFVLSDIPFPRMKLGIEAKQLRKDAPTVNAKGELLRPMIAGVTIRRSTPQHDRRGEITEMYDPRWAVDDQPMVYAYQVSILPGAIRGWEMHKIQTDRIFISRGWMRWVLYDLRKDSPTYRLLNEFVISELSRSLMIVPTGIIHAVQNIGRDEAVFINFPTAPYSHSDPDKFRLPIGTDLIPYTFNQLPGW